MLLILYFALITYYLNRTQTIITVWQLNLNVIIFYLEARQNVTIVMIQWLTGNKWL